MDIIEVRNQRYTDALPLLESLAGNLAATLSVALRPSNRTELDSSSLCSSSSSLEPFESAVLGVLALVLFTELDMFGLQDFIDVRVNTD